MGKKIAKKKSVTFRRDLHRDLKADYVLANGSMGSNQSGEGDIYRTLQLGGYATEPASVKM